MKLLHSFRLVQYRRWGWLMSTGLMPTLFVPATRQITVSTFTASRLDIPRV